MLVCVSALPCEFLCEPRCEAVLASEQPPKAAARGGKAKAALKKWAKTRWGRGLTRLDSSHGLSMESSGSKLQNRKGMLSHVERMRAEDEM